jgi:menaquinol-cytochrome c reductase iron-sulfur subunit
MKEKLPAPRPQYQRRSFFKEAAALLLGGIVTTVPFVAGLLTFLDPLRRRSGGGGFVRVTSLSALSDDGTPRRFSVVADREDAWNRFPQVPIGAVYLRRVGAQVQALNVSCPHAGCAVDYKPGERSYGCPCHDSSFKLDGTLANPRSPSPRAMDSLEVEVRNDAEIWVKFVNFEAGKAKKIPLA